MRAGLFALPILMNGEELDGLAIPQAAECAKCVNRICEDNPSAVSRASLCDEGQNYIWVTSDALIRGVVIDGHHVTVDASALAKSKFRRRVKSGVSTVSEGLFYDLIKAVRGMVLSEVDEHRRQMVDSAKKWSTLLR